MTIGTSTLRRIVRWASGRIPEQNRASVSCPIIPQKVKDFVARITPVIERYIEESEGGNWTSCGGVSDGIVLQTKRHFPEAEATIIKVCYFKSFHDPKLIAEFKHLYLFLRNFSENHNLFSDNLRDATRKFNGLWMILFSEAAFYVESVRKDGSISIDDGSIFDLLKGSLTDSDGTVCHLTYDNYKYWAGRVNSNFDNLNISEVENLLLALLNSGINFPLLKDYSSYPIQLGFWHIVAVLKVREGTYMLDGTAPQFHGSCDKPTVTIARYDLDSMLSEGYIPPLELPDFNDNFYRRDPRNPAILSRFHPEVAKYFWGT